MKNFYIKILDNIKNNNIKEICTSFFAISHFNNNMFTLSEKEFKSTINFIQEKEKKLKIGGKDEIDKIKEEIKRSSNVPYLNEYSKFENIDEHMQEIIYLNIYKQRYIYLYAMNKFKLANNVNNENIDLASRGKKINIKKEKEKRDNYLKEAIKYFNECKNIN